MAISPRLATSNFCPVIGLALWEETEGKGIAVGLSQSLAQHRLLDAPRILT
jgi:hypothetical protein